MTEVLGELLHAGPAFTVPPTGRPPLSMAA
jgi:hypothetical protein